MGNEKKKSQISDIEVLERMKEYHTKNFDRMQLEEIREGIKNGVDVSIYADEKYIFLQMAEIRKGLENGIDVTPYLDEEYDWFQMREIRRGLIEGVDVSVYLPETGSPPVMCRWQRLWLPVQSWRSSSRTCWGG